MNRGIICNQDNVDEERLQGLKFKRKFIFSSKKGDLKFNIRKRIIQYKGKELKLPMMIPPILIPHIAAIFSFSVNYGFSLEEAGFEALRFDLSNILIKRIKENIGKERTH